MVLLCKLMIVFNDAIVYQRDPARRMRMGVRLSNAAVGGPPGMANAAVGDFIIQGSAQFPQAGNLSCSLYLMDPGIIAKISDARAVIAAVFQLCQPVEHDFSGV